MLLKSSSCNCAVSSFWLSYLKMKKKKPSPIAQLVALQTWEQEVADSIPGSANILSEDWWWSFRQDSFLFRRCPLFQQWLSGKAASGFERILCRALVKKTPRKHGYMHWLLWINWNTVENSIKHHTINQSVCWKKPDSYVWFNLFSSLKDFPKKEFKRIEFLWIFEYFVLQRMDLMFYFKS